MTKIATLIDKCKKEDGPDLDEEIEALANDIGWNNVLIDAYQILCNRKFRATWYGAVSIISWAAEDGIEMPVSKKEVIARLYWCLREYESLGVAGGADGNNLVWSVASTLAQVSYTSSWQPLEDIEIRELVNHFD